FSRDWSSDVCSSDLGRAHHAQELLAGAVLPVGARLQHVDLAAAAVDDRAERRRPELARLGREAVAVAEGDGDELALQRDGGALRAEERRVGEGVAAG